MAYYAAGTIIPSKLHIFQAASNKNDHLPFLKLPGEIRNRIYDLVFQECLVEIGLGDPPNLGDESIKQPLTQSQKQLQKHHDEKRDQSPQNGSPRAPKKQYSSKSFRLDSIVGSKQQKQTVSQDQPDSVPPPQSSKPKSRRRKYGRKSPLRMYSRAMVTPGGTVRPTHHHRAFDFLFSSRQIYNEALCIMYAKTTFRFIPDKAINRFLSMTPCKALQAIQGLEISHETAEEPVLTAHRKFKLADDKNWLMTCKQIRAKMTDLKKLRLHLILKDWPIQLRPQEEWAQAIFCLRGKGLDRFDATLEHEAFSKERLHEAAQNLEIAIMGKQAWTAKQVQDRKMVEAKKAQESKKAKVLVIKMGDLAPILPQA